MDISGFTIITDLNSVSILLVCIALVVSLHNFSCFSCFNDNMILLTIKPNKSYNIKYHWLSLANDSCGIWCLYNSLFVKEVECYFFRMLIIHFIASIIYDVFYVVAITTASHHRLCLNLPFSQNKNYVLLVLFDQKSKCSFYCFSMCAINKQLTLSFPLKNKIAFIFSTLD